MHPRNNTFPGEVFLRLAADALDWSGASRADPVTLEGMRERFLPECAFRGRGKRKLFRKDFADQREDNGNGVQVQRLCELPDVLCVAGPRGERLHREEMLRRSGEATKARVVEHARC